MPYIKNLHSDINVSRITNFIHRLTMSGLHNPVVGGTWGLPPFLKTPGQTCQGLKTLVTSAFPSMNEESNQRDRPLIKTST